MPSRCSEIISAPLALLVLSGAIGAGQAGRMRQYSLVTIPGELLERPVLLRDGIGAAHEMVSDETN